jgi:hypothetical protein
MTVTESIAIIGLCVAGYGAILSSVNSVFQIIAHRKDRADIIVIVRRNMVVTNRMDQKYTIVTAVNRGKRPVTIQGFAARHLDSPLCLLFPDVRPQVPRILNESESMAAWIPWVGGVEGLPIIESFFVEDSIGRQFSHHIVPWYRRALSKYRRKRELDTLEKLSRKPGGIGAEIIELKTPESVHYVKPQDQGD